MFSKKYRKRTSEVKTYKEHSRLKQSIETQKTKKIHLLKQSKSSKLTTRSGKLKLASVI